MPFLGYRARRKNKNLRLRSRRNFGGGVRVKSSLTGSVAFEYLLILRRPLETNDGNLAPAAAPKPAQQKHNNKTNKLETKVAHLKIYNQTQVVEINPPKFQVFRKASD